MPEPLTKDTKIVLKLDLGEKGVRRLTLSKLWDESRSAVSYDRLVKIAIGHSDMPLKAVRNGRVSVSTTYTDEDGDEITISSDEELADAFAQFVNSEPPVVRAKAVVMKQQKKVGAGSQNQDRSGLNRVQNREFNRLQKNPAFLAGMTNLNQVKPPVPFPSVVRLPPVAPPKKADGNTKVDDTLGCDPDFIHGRHTCDGCLSTPIYGIRYHATNKADYDICSSCHSNYTGTDITFKPMQLDRDRHLQTRWQRRRMKRCRPMVKRQGLDNGLQSGTQTLKVIEGLDGPLKEAIRRSLVDSWPKENKSEEASVKTVTTEEGSVTATPKEEDIPVATCVEISAGNEHTQKSLDRMDPKVKEALSRNLNQFFARRCADRNKDSVSPSDDMNLFPTIETQKKIDSMDSAVKEAVHRSLNQFFATRRASKENKNEEEGDIQRTQEILDTMDGETKERISRSLNDFFARRMNKNETQSECEHVKEDMPSVVIDIVVDDDDDDLSHETEDASKIDLDNESKMSEDSAKNDEWQMVTEDDEMIAVAAQMLGSALFQSDASLVHDSCHSS